MSTSTPSAEARARQCARMALAAATAEAGTATPAEYARCVVRHLAAAERAGLAACRGDAQAAAALRAVFAAARRAVEVQP